MNLVLNKYRLWDQLHGVVTSWRDRVVLFIWFQLLQFLLVGSRIRYVLGSRAGPWLQGNAGADEKRQGPEHVNGRRHVEHHLPLLLAALGIRRNIGQLVVRNWFVKAVRAWLYFMYDSLYILTLAHSLSDNRHVWISTKSEDWFVRKLIFYKRSGYFGFNLPSPNFLSQL